LAETYWGLYREDDAIRELELLASEEPQNQVIWSWLGYYLLQMGEFERARPALERFAALAPDNANSYTLLGDTLRYQGQFQAAIGEYERALAIDPRARDVAASLAAIEYLNGNYASAQQKFQQITDNGEMIIRERLDAMFPLASLQAARGDFAGAIATLESFADALSEEHYREAMATSMLALYQLELGREDPAREVANAAIGLSPGVPTRYLFARGLIELETRQYDAVLATAREIEGHALPPDDPDRTEEKAAAYLMGMAFLAQDQFARAGNMLGQAVVKEGYAYAIYELGLARLLMRQGKPDEATALMEGALDLDFVDPRVDLELDRVRSILLRAEIQQAGGDDRAAKASAEAFLARFDQADPAHPDFLHARSIADPADHVAFVK